MLAIKCRAEAATFASADADVRKIEFALEAAESFISRDFLAAIFLVSPSPCFSCLHAGYYLLLYITMCVDIRHEWHVCPYWAWELLEPPPASEAATTEEEEEVSSEEKSDSLERLLFFTKCIGRL